jgi:hypothetical protein
MRKFVFLFFLILIMTACGTAGKNDFTHQSRSMEPLPSVKEVQKGDFVYRLFSEKDVYAPFDDTAIFAELTYVGDLESIDIYHAASPFYFPLEERTRGIEVDYAMDEPLIITTLKKGEPFSRKYGFAGGYSDQDEIKYVEFVKSLMNERFPEGDYIIHGSVEFAITDPSEATDEERVKLKADIGFTVKEPVS